MTSLADDDRDAALTVPPRATQRESAGLPRPGLRASGGAQAPDGDHFGPLVPFSYDLIMADPPWPYRLRSPKGEVKSAQSRYGCMAFKEIAALPVGQLAARDAVLFLWCTWPLLLDGGEARSKGDPSHSSVGEVIKAWGFRFVTGGVWMKRTPSGKLVFGTGYRARSACEPFLLAVMGSPDTSRAERNVIDGLRREHSRKPEEAFAWCERYLPGARRLELFSRQSRPGWDTWGLEAGKFDPVVSLQAPEPGTMSVFPPAEEDEKSDIDEAGAAA